ncbi:MULTISPECIES: cytochrome c oxidase subunit 3 [Crateriforma]|nr:MULTISPECIES: cytochrome c oxidase subunit 3 [Crateriforma]
MPRSNKNRPHKLPSDHRAQQGGMLFLLSLVIFFLSSLLLYGLYAYWRRDDPQSQMPLPLTFLISTGCLLAISGLVHAATRTVRRQKRWQTSILLITSSIAAVLFMYVQFRSMRTMMSGSDVAEGIGRGVIGMVFVLAFLHALHVAGGIISLAIVSVRSVLGKYDHERHWPVDFAAHYWHFLDVVWLMMLATFWMTTGGFA